MCTNIPYFDTLVYGLSYYLSTNWGIVDSFFDVIFPVLIRFVYNLALFICVVYQNMIFIDRIRDN